MLLIKIGGGKEINIEGIISDLGSVNEDFIIVHGANYLRDDLARKLNYEKKSLTSVSGYSSVYTDQDGMDIMMMAYAGLRNKRIVELCLQKGINAIGLSGLDGGLIRAKRNTGIRIRENNKLRIVRDLSGKPDSINVDLLKLLLENKFKPVISVPVLDENNIAVNTENDEIIAAIHNSLAASKIIQLIEAPGLLIEKDNPKSLLPKLDLNQLLSFEETVQGRMKRKILALRKLLESNPVKIIITDGRVENPLFNALNEKGTIIE